MAKVIRLSDIKPKQTTHVHMGQRYTCTFDPNASKGEQWVWELDFVRTYKFFGAAPTEDAAMSRASRQIKSMTDFIIDLEERHE